ncbi:sensor histidine kinase [Methylobacterium mesophilicum SR1.6/6]|uniref:histidine kinase n=1 Tax=Methylobacterium mesophilicum SR1.6/6 TaxID=908290 RepID=A0A6B9FB93_9HYPH|nr:HWE histidine kinase domain-containing protein [Methylobacterium mesophilicum]QGY00920.1 sensor histidine kinase [Methylobacterium mesophilicum SR1.6/6]
MTDPDDVAGQLAALRADNARLRRLLDEAGMPDSLRHGVRNTMAMLRTIVRRSAESAGDVEAYAAHLDGRLHALTRIQATTDAFGEANLHTLISDELLFHLVREGERATIDGPHVRLRPKAALVLALAVHELTSNGVEHGFLALPQGRVTVSWRVEPSSPEPTLVLTWKEEGGTGVTKPAQRGFGTALLEDMLAYEIDARSALTYEPDGLRCTLLIPLATWIGRLVEPAAAHGAGDDRD